MTRKTLPVFLWLVVPVLIILGQIGIELSIHDYDVLARLHSETGPHETFQAFIIFAALLVALHLLWRTDWTGHGWARLAVLVCIPGCLYIFGEEISWGQHLFGWATPEFWTHVNDQSETNLHNTSSWLDQKPRLLLFIGSVVAGLIIPALRCYRPALLPARFVDLYPSATLVPVTLGVLFPYGIDSAWEAIYGAALFERVSEVQEIYLFYFIFLYLLDMKNRLEASTLLTKI